MGDRIRPSPAGLVNRRRPLGIAAGAIRRPLGGPLR
jgi:hypothetical protein